MRAQVLITALGIFMALSCPRAMAFTLEDAVLIEYGAYVPTSQANYTEDQGEGTYTNFAGFSLVYEGDTITIDPEHWFGFTFRFIGEPEGEPVSFVLRLILPDGGMFDSPGQEPMGHNIWRVVRMSPELIVPGEYTLELRLKNRVLLSRSFLLEDGNGDEEGDILTIDADKLGIIK